MKKMIYTLLFVFTLLLVLSPITASVLAEEDEAVPEEVTVQNLEEVVVENEEAPAEEAPEAPAEEAEANEAPEAPVVSEENSDETEVPEGKEEPEQPAEQTEEITEAEKAEGETAAPEVPAVQEETKETTEPAETVDSAEEVKPEETEEPEETEPEFVVNPAAEPYLNAPGVYVDEDGNIVTDQATFLLRIPGTIRGNSTSTIVPYGFYGWQQLSVVVIPSNITTIGEQAFASCPNLGVIILEGRADASGMNLGYAWNGSANVIYGLIENEIA